MPSFQIFSDGPEYLARIRKGTFKPPDISLNELRKAVPKRLTERSTIKSMYYTFQHIAITAGFYSFGLHIDSSLAKFSIVYLDQNSATYFCLRQVLWLIYWGFQGFAFAGHWCLGHEAGHNALSPFAAVNVLIGMSLHTFVLTPYHSWAITHGLHHKSTNNLHRDETFHPYTRKDLQLPDGKIAVKTDYLEILEETPAYTLIKLFVRQFFGFQLYLLHNRKGNPRYPVGTSHYNPKSQLFQPRQSTTVWTSVMISNAAILLMLCLLYEYGKRAGFSTLCAHYLMPWLFAHNWIVTFAYLQHSDPTIPHYRKDQWTFARGALATVDRPLFGWVGRLLLHNISSDHVAHHFFPMVPFYNLPEVTEAIKPVLGEYYNYDSTPVIWALWRSFTQCVFVEDETDVVFFKNRFGEALIEANTSGISSF